MWTSCTLFPSRTPSAPHPSARAWRGRGAEHLTKRREIGLADPDQTTVAHGGEGA